MNPDQRRRKQREQAHGKVLLDSAHTAGIVAFVAVVVFFVYVSLLRSFAPFAFLPAFLIAVLTTIFSIAYVMVVMIHKDI